jgi:hypothetical protein
MCEFPAVYHMKARRARKEHRCCECGGKILSGESYNYHCGVWDGQGRSFKVCVDCDRLRTRINAGVDADDTVPFCYLLETVRDRGVANEVREMLRVMRMRGVTVPTDLAACEEVPVL